jgi:hypothetical protein
MDAARYRELETDQNAEFTPKEKEQGWHFCPDWDYMTVGPGMEEQDSCCCDRFR